LRDFLIATFSHPNIVGFMFWGFAAEHSWVQSNAIFYNADWTPRLGLQAYRDLVFNRWWTDVAGVTNADGVFATKAYLGDYNITYTAGGATQTVPVTVSGGQINYLVNGANPPAPQVSASGVLNAASRQPGAVSPGELVVIQGSGIGLSTPEYGTYDDTGSLPTALSLTRVLFDGNPATLLAAGAGAVTAVVPAGVSGTTNISVETLGVASTPVSVAVAAASPAFFTCPLSTDLPVTVSGTPSPAVSCTAGAATVSKGAAVSFYATGLTGSGDQILFAGQPAPACAASAETLSAPGVWQFTTCVPANAGSGPLEVKLQSGTLQSPAVHVDVR
jgi:uncharacterized protein (TIGR03437 family)